METPATLVLAGKPDSVKNVRVAAVAWILTSVDYFYQYSLRSAPAVMMPELSKAFGITPLALTSISVTKQGELTNASSNWNREIRTIAGAVQGPRAGPHRGGTSV